MNTEDGKMKIAEIEISDVCDFGKVWDKFDFNRDFEKLVIFCQSKCPEKENLLRKNKQFFFENGIDSLKSLFYPPAYANYFFLKEKHEKVLQNQIAYRFLKKPEIENFFWKHINGIIYTDKTFFVFSQERGWILKDNQDIQYEPIDDNETIRILNNSKIFYDSHGDPVFWIDGELKKRKHGKWETSVPRNNLPPIVESIYWENTSCCVLGRNPDENLLLIKCDENYCREFDKDLNVLQAAHFGNETILISRVRGCSDYIVMFRTNNENFFQKENEFTSSRRIRIYPFNEIIFLAYHDKLKFRFKEERDWKNVNIVLDYITKFDNQYIGIKDGSIYSSQNGDSWLKKGEIARKGFHPIYFAKNENQIVFSSQNSYEICQITRTKGE